ncbi:MAG: hypothetical protein M3203_13250 [Actinomycetota bacterium]|nr:hypothetical protein [Actinomycetota bacterium]
MFRRNRNKQEASAQADMPETAPPAAPQASSPGGYVPFELPTYHKGKRKVVVYTSDANGRIIKTFKK